MERLEKIIIIYNFLQSTTADLNLILNHLADNKIQTSKRQLERDLKVVEMYLLKENEQILFSIVNRAKCYRITKKSNLKLEQNTINTLYLALISSPNILIENRKNDIDYFQSLIQNEINNNENDFTLSNASQHLVGTHFYEIKKDEIFNKNIDALVSAITNHYFILLDELKNDFTVDNHNLTTKVFEFAPLKIIYHRGAFLVAGFQKENLKEIVIYEVGQITKLKIQKVKFNFKSLIIVLNKELDKRFGITKNIDNEVYKIQLEFTNITGSLVKKYFWHHSQKFIQKSSNGNVIMSIESGINRELLGWIYQWMYNVKIIEPQILIDLYKETHNRIKDNLEENKPFVYKNIFEPK